MTRRSVEMEPFPSDHLPSEFGDSNTATPIATSTKTTDEAVMQALWGEQTSDFSTSLDYVRDHAHRMIDRVVHEDPHVAYIPLRVSHDVRLFTLATLPTETPLEKSRCDFRGVTRVPGSVETVLEMLASENERESYWIALNTQRGLLVNSLFATRRLQGNAPFPRWNQRYAATKFSKHSPPVECCFNEYATYYTPPQDQELHATSDKENKRPRLTSYDSMQTTERKRAFLYRRSMDHRLFNMEDVQEKLSKYGESCERLYLADYLFEIAETTEPHICKVVLTCSVYFTSPNNSNSSQSMMHNEYREFCTNVLQSLRTVLTNQWKDHMASAGVLAPSSASLLSRSLRKRTSSSSASGSGSGNASHPSRCGVCSTGFSILKKRHVCHSCALVVCSRCCIKPDRSLSSSMLRRAPHDLHCGRATKECILCSQFGSEIDGVSGGGGGGASRLSVSIRRHFTSSTSTLSSARSVTTSVSELDEELHHDRDRDTASETSSAVSELHDHDHDHGYDHDHEDEVATVVHSLEELDNQQESESEPEPPLSMTSSFSSRAGGKQIYGLNKMTPRNNLRVRASTEDNTFATTWREGSENSELLPRQISAPSPAPSPSPGTQRRMKQRSESAHFMSTARGQGSGVVLLTDIDALSLTGSFHRLSMANGGITTTATTMPGGGSRRGSGGASDSGSASSFVRASPPFAPAMVNVQRAMRSVSDDCTTTRTTTLLPANFALDGGGGENAQDGANTADALESGGEVVVDEDLANFNLKLL